MMKKYFLAASCLLFLTACSSESEEKVDAIEEEEEVAEAVPTEEERDAYLDSNKYIVEHEHETPSENQNQVYLTIKMNEEFARLKISEQYLYLVEFYEDYNEKFKDLLPVYSFLNRMKVYLNDTEFPAYEVYAKSFHFVAANFGIDRNTGQIPDNEILTLIDTLDKKQVMSGTYNGLTQAEVETGAEPKVRPTLITSSGEVKGALASGVSSNPGVQSSSNNNENNDTYIKSANGYNWVKFTGDQKFEAVSNALYWLDRKGYTILESEYYYISALNEFYTDPSTMDTAINQAVASVGIMSNTMTK
ncbi:hypothetical protein [Pseudobacillus badius]|uniref:hypothetical protein n=1 Tax=Bacillus badius TaxID=1455 RepID=UPI003D3265CA